MAKTRYIQTNFTAGMLTDQGGGRLLGRPDLTKYHNGAKTLKNVLIFKTGGVARRPGMGCYLFAKYPDHAARLVSFIYNVNQAYILEFGDVYLRFWKPGGIQVETSPGSLVPYELVTPYIGTDIFNLSFQQSADTLYIGGIPDATRRHNPTDYPPMKLVRIADNNWQLSQINFLPPPSEERPRAFNANLTINSTTGTSVSGQADQPIWLVGDKNCQILSGAGRGILLDADVGGRLFTINILDPFPSTFLQSGQWLLKGSPSAALDFNRSRPEHAQVTASTDVQAFRPEDVGKFILGYGGCVQITQVVDANNIVGEILSILRDAPASPADPDPIIAGNWTLESPAWDFTTGFPKAPLFHEERLLWARKEDIWGSVTSDFENHAPGSADDDAIHYALSSNTIDWTEWLLSDDRLYIGTAGGVHAMTGSGNNDGEPLTPNPPRRRRISSARCSSIPPILIDHAIIFPERALRQLKELRYDLQSDSMRPYELTDLNEVILQSGVKQMAFQQVPDPRLWIVRNDGKVVTLTYYRNEDVLGWSLIETQAFAIPSLAIIPSADGSTEEVWVSVQRIFDGQLVQIIEVFIDGLQTDCATVFSPVAGTTQISNLNRFANTAVKVFVNGAAQADKVVSESGVVTLDRPTAAGDSVEVGLQFFHEITTMPPEIPGAPTIQGMPKRWVDLFVRVLNSKNAVINGTPIEFLSGGDPMDAAPPAYTGDKRVTDFGISTDGTITIKDDRGPFTLLMVWGNLAIGDQ